MIEVVIETGVPNWYFRVQRKNGRLNVVMHRDMIEFSLVVDENDFRSGINALCLMKEDDHAI